ncbi:hypothetical protein WA026_023098 [Henosepilachna vigintioctopunctata]|uniref:Isopenicillin N synthase-like Fe(2+) 2OG dioxygenase domain-containing protein n=1 Tax=Henosepilachna vigintioctopunctata TaxID=420089 RepID=A0AAW1UD70_9CUCU
MASTNRDCGCKGYRTCLICEEKYGIEKENSYLKQRPSYVYCMHCNKCYQGWNIDLYNQHPNHIGDSLNFPGVYIQLNFITEKEEDYLIQNIDSISWDSSQSGRRKQNYGPKCNFKRQKIKLGNFMGFPLFSEFVQKKFEQVPIMKNFYTIEQCSLEYDPKTGASIDPHIDDCWVWGERIVTVNLNSDSVLTMTRNEKTSRYNLACVRNYPAILDKNGIYNQSLDSFLVNSPTDTFEYPVVRIPMPRRSLLIMYGAARYEWEHQILREDIVERRICLAYREFTPSFLEGSSNYNIGKEILNKAKIFF